MERTVERTVEKSSINNKEQYFKDYNRQYYIDNREELLAYHSKKAQCESCHRIVRKCAINETSSDVKNM